MAETEYGKLRFGSYHLPADPEVHVAAWGARLILSEVMDGSGGVVWDRQDNWGPKGLVETLFPCVDRLVETVRGEIRAWRMTSGSHEGVSRRDGRVLAVASPQGSFGYLYVTAVMFATENEAKAADTAALVEAM